MSTIEAPLVRRVQVADLKPYFNNPRRIPDEAITAVQDSVTRYGYNQPIVIDGDGVIVVGHTRHQALLQLGVTEVDVIVTELPADLVREYRLVDNRTGESGQWDHEKLVAELREFEDSLRIDYFPNVSLEVDLISKATEEVTDEKMREAVERIERVPNKPVDVTTGVVCPACTEVFQVVTKTLPGITFSDMEVLSDRAASADGRDE